MASIEQLTYVKPQVLEWHEVPAPHLQTGKDALIKPLAVARCDLDGYIVLGQYRTPGPFALGHETAGMVVDVGDSVTGCQPGDQVIVPFQISCGECSHCRRGWTNACLMEAPCAAFGLGTHPTEDYGGGLSDLIRVPYADAMLVPIPDGTTITQACGLSDNVADGFRTVAPFLKQFPGEPVLVVGGLAQSVGLYAVQAALALGSERVVYVDDDPKRLASAQKLGATIYRTDFKQQHSAEQDFLITVDANCTPDGMAYAIRSTAACGFCTSVSGGLSPSTELPLNQAYLKGIQYNVSRVHGRATLPSVLDQVCCGKLDPLVVAHREVSFGDAAEAMFADDIKIIFIR